MASPSQPADAPLSDWRDFGATAIACAVSVPIGLRLQRHQRFLPLLVLGSMGGLIDFYGAMSRARAAQAALAAASASASAAAPATPPQTPPQST
jgi:hypothetical protein